MSYVPDRGHVVILRFDPAEGREIGKRRPALVLSPKRYNRVTGLALVCPMTTRTSDYPFEVPANTKNLAGAFLADMPRSIDWRARRAELVGPVPSQILSEVTGKLATLIGFAPSS